MMKGKIRKILSLLMAFTMVMNLNLVTGYSVKLLSIMRLL